MYKKILSLNGKALGHGTYGRVTVVRYLGKRYAVKRVPVNEYATLYAAVREEHYGELQHRNLVRRYYSWWSRGIWFGIYEVGVVLEVPSGVPNPSKALACLRDISRGVAFLHARGIAHRDIKPANIINTDEGYKLIDFGLARPFGSFDTSQTGYTCSRWWRPPELLDGDTTDCRCDVWSLAVVCLSIHRGKQVIMGTVEEILSALPIVLSESESVYGDMLVRDRCSIFDVCDKLGIRYNLDVSVRLPSALRRKVLIGEDVEWHMYRKKGIR